MAQIELKTRIQNKIDTQANWDVQTNFVPLAGEIIIYKDLNKFKIGDGKTKLANLPFITAEKLNIADIVNNLTSTATDKPLAAAQGKALKDLIDENDAANKKYVDDKMTEVINQILSMYPPAEDLIIYPTVEGVEF